MDALHRLRMNNLIESLIRKKTKGGRNLTGGGRQHQLKPTETISSSLPSASESSAFNERKKNRALYGKHGRGGLEREKIGLAKDEIANRADIAASEAKSRARENLGRYGGIDEWGRAVEGTENIRAGAARTLANRPIAKDPIFEQFETPNPTDPLNPRKTLGRYNRGTGQFDPMEMSTPNQAQAVRKPAPKKKDKKVNDWGRWDSYITR